MEKWLHGLVRGKRLVEVREAADLCLINFLRNKICIKAMQHVHIKLQFQSLANICVEEIGLEIGLGKKAHGDSHRLLSYR